jgi:proteasome regulatory subunit
MPLSSDVDLIELAKLTEGATGADIRYICTEAALHAIKHGKLIVERKDFIYAIDKVLKRRLRPYVTEGQAFKSTNLMEYHL